MSCDSILYARNHYLGGLHQGRGGLAFTKLHLAGRVGCDDGGNALVADREDDLGEQAADLHFDDLADQLISSADLAKPLAGLLRLWCGFEQRNKRATRDEVMSARRFYA